MGGLDKQIKIQAAVDDASFAKAKRAISELTREVSKLVEQTNRVNLSFGGGGGGMGARVSGMTPPSGGGSAVAATQHRMQTSTGGVADNLTKAVVNSTQLFKTAAQGSRDAFRIMQDSLRSMVSQSDRDIRTLTTSLERLEKTYEKLKQRQAGGRGGALTDAAVSQVQGQYYSGAQQVANASAQSRALRAEAGKFEYENDAGTILRRRLFSGQQGGGGGGGIGGILNANVPGTGSGGFLQKAGLGALAGGAGLVAAGVAGFNYVNGAMRTQDMSNLGQSLESPFWKGEKQATYGRIFGGGALSIRHGDMSRAAAMRKLTSDSEFKKVVDSDKYKEWQRLQAEKSTPVGLAENLAAGSATSMVSQKVGQGATAFSDRFLRGAERIGGWFGKSGGFQTASSSGYGDDTKQELERKKRMAFLQTAQPEAYEKMVQNQMQADPMMNDVMNRVYGGALGSMSMSRALGVSGGTVRDKFGNIKGNSLANARARFMGAGYDPGEAAGMMGQMSGQGFGFKQHGTLGMLSMSHGGLGNAASLFGVGAQFGGGTAAGGDRFMRTIQGSIGRGGLDVTAGANLFGAGASAMQGGNFSGSGTGLMTSLAEAASTGTTGGDMRMGRIVQGGLGAMGQMMSGGIDPLQQGLNASAAMKAAPDAPYATHQALMSMDPASLLDTIKTGKIPPYLSAMGVTLPILQKYMAAQNTTAFARASDKMGAGTDAGAAMARYRGAGGNLSYLKKMKSGERGAELTKLAAGLKMAGGAGSYDDALGRLKLQASAEGVLPKVKGKGAHQTASKDSIYGVAAQEQGAVEKTEGDVYHVGKEGEIKDVTRAARHIGTASEAARESMVKQAGKSDVDGAIDNVDAALRGLVNSLRTMVTGAKATSGAMKASPPKKG